MNWSPIGSPKPAKKRYFLKRTPLKKKPYKIVKVSKKKSKELYNESKIKIQLMKRCNGLCEYCGKPPDFRGLHPHEEIFRSQGGKLSLENSKMSCGKCHSLAHNIIEVKE